MKKLILLLTLSTTFICSSALSANNEPYYSIDATTLNVRQEPNSTSQIIGTLKKGTRVEIIEDTGLINKIDNIYASWLKIKFGAKVGYIFGGYVAQRVDSLDFEKPYIFNFQTYKSKLTSFKTEAKIYEFPDTNSKVLSSIGFAETIESINIAYTATSVKNHILWYHVSFENQEGFVSSSDIVTDTIERNSMIYGVNSYPVSVQKWYPSMNSLYRDSEVIVLSTKKQKIIQRFKLAQPNDELSFIENQQFNNIFNTNILVIKHEWSGYAHYDNGYIANSIYSLNEDGEIKTKLFMWFGKIAYGYDDLSSGVLLKDIMISKNSIIVKYNYQDSTTENSNKSTNLSIKYVITNNKVKLEHIQSKVLQIKKWITSKSGDQTLENLKKPVILYLDKKILNQNLKKEGNVYSFIYE